MSLLLGDLRLLVGEAPARRPRRPAPPPRDHVHTAGRGLDPERRQEATMTDDRPEPEDEA